MENLSGGSARCRGLFTLDFVQPRERHEVDYSRDVAPILSANCLECHRSGDVAPFPLQTYEEVKRRARMIASVCSTLSERELTRWLP